MVGLAAFVILGLAVRRFMKSGVLKMDIASLQQLASHGFAGVAGDRLGDLAIWCRDFAEATGDARYSTIGEALRSLHEWLIEHDKYGGIPVGLRDDIERILITLLPAILDAPTPTDAAPIARTMREQVQNKLTGLPEWTAEGYFERP